MKPRGDLHLPLNMANRRMPDVFTIEKRSQVMSRIRGHGNKDTELALAKLFRAHGITGWRRRQNHFGKPDFTFRRERLVVFVDGCFWHGCPKHSNLPVNNRPFWKRKLAANTLRDRLVTKTLRKQGWRVLRIWEHDLSRNATTCIHKIKAALAKVD
jgi:DNA mismatch endonuclease, patch repair protein